jgi:hypothetical protein
MHTPFVSEVCVILAPLAHPAQTCQLHSCCPSSLLSLLLSIVRRHQHHPPPSPVHCLIVVFLLLLLSSLSSVLHCPLSSACCPLSIVCCLLSIVCCLSSIVHRQPSIVMSSPLLPPLHHHHQLYRLIIKFLARLDSACTCRPPCPQQQQHNCCCCCCCYCCCRVPALSSLLLSCPSPLCLTSHPSPPCAEEEEALLMIALTSLQRHCHGMEGRRSKQEEFYWLCWLPNMSFFNVVGQKLTKIKNRQSSCHVESDSTWPDNCQFAIL